jgi:inorganic pyrophosphatase
MLDGGRHDEKIIAIPFSDPNYNKYKDITDLPPHIFDEMTHFFTVYKALEDKETVTGEVNGREAAIDVIASSLDNYIEKFCK